MTTVEIHLPRDGRDVRGMHVAPTRQSWPAASWFDPSPLIAQGCSHLRVIAHGNTIVPRASWADATLSIDEPRIRVSLEGEWSMVCATKRACLIGATSRGTSKVRPIRFDWSGGVVVSDGGGSWLVDSYQWTGVDEDVTYDAEACTGDGHARYDRGCRGAVHRNVLVTGAWKEALKKVERMPPGAGGPTTKHTENGTPWPGRPLFLYDGCVVRGFGLSGSGGGIITQGAAGDTVLHGTSILGHGMLLGFNDGTTLDGYESYGYDGTPLGHPANGAVYLSGETLLRWHGPATGNPNVPAVLVRDVLAFDVSPSVTIDAPAERVVIG